MYLDNLERGEVIDSDFDLINLATWLYALWKYTWVLSDQNWTYCHLFYYHIMTMINKETSMWNNFSFTFTLNTDTGIY